MNSDEMIAWWMMISAGKTTLSNRSHSHIDKKTEQMEMVYGFSEYAICKLLTIWMRELTGYVCDPGKSSLQLFLSKGEEPSLFSFGKHQLNFC